MRNLLLIAAFAMSLFIAPSCNKDDDDTNSSENQIAGKWNFDRVEYNDFENGISERYTEQGEPGDYVNFLENGTLMIRNYGEEETGSWSINNKTLRLVDEDGDEDLYDILTLDASALVFYNKDTAGADYYEEAYYLSR